MPKHLKHTKKNIKKNAKKRVQHNVKKLKEITAKDLLMDPSLIHSPQFKALPMSQY